MRRQQRRVFAAPFILSIVVAAPACKPGGADGKGPEEPKKPPTEEVDPVTAAEPYNQWMVSANDEGNCSAYYREDCPEGAFCNPPPPAKVACPAGVTGDVEMRLLQLEENGACYVEPADCTADCDRQPAECPTWD